MEGDRNNGIPDGSELLAKGASWQARDDFLVEGRPRQEKIIVALTVVVIVLAIFFVFYQSISSFRRPAKNFAKLASQASANCADGSCQGDQSESEAVLRQKDTDQDGLSDYDELYTYKTSPYLEDTDSDGMSDKREIDQKFDPNCPGKDPCFTFDFEQINSNQGGGVPTFQTMPNTASSGMSAQTLREFLKADGFTDEELAQFTDEELLSQYNQFLAETQSNQQGGTGTAAANTNSSGGLDLTNASGPSGNIDLNQLNIKSIDDLKKLTGAQIRQLMIQQGAPAEALSDVSDQELKEMFLTQLESKISEMNINK